MTYKKVMRERNKTYEDTIMIIGLATLQCNRERMQFVVEAMLESVRGELRETLFVTLQRQKIAIPKNFADESQKTRAMVNERIAQQRASAASARAERAALADYKKKWRDANLVRSETGSLSTPQPENKP